MKHILFLTSFLFVGLSVWAQSKLTQEQIKKGHYQEINFGIGADTIKLDSYPMYPGGLNGFNNDIASNLSYPKQALDLSMEGVVKASFIIDTLGYMTHCKIVESNYLPFSWASQEALKKIKKDGYLHIKTGKRYAFFLQHL